MELKVIRKRRELTLSQLAKKAGVAKSTLSRLERSHNMPNHGTVVALEDALNLKRGSLVFAEPERASA